MRATIEDAERMEAKLRQGWTQLAMARRSNGAITSPSFSDASCWCLIGAARAATHTEEAAFELIAALDRRICGQVEGRDAHERVMAWNDASDRTQAEVLELAALVKEDVRVRGA